VSGEINALALKSAPASADIVIIEDSENSFAKRKATLSSVAFDIRNIIVFDHFMSGSSSTDRIGIMGWNSSVGGGGATITYSGIDGRPGVINLVSGTAGNGRAAIFLGSNVIGQGRVKLGGTNPMLFEALVRFPTAADFDAANLEQVMLGLGLAWSTDAELPDGVYIRYTPGVDSFWSLVTASSSTRTVVASSVAPVGGSWVRLGFSATASSVQLYVNGTAHGSPITTNIPAIELAIGMMGRSGGGLGVSLSIDYALLTQVTDKET